jgi:hypothetical protein
MVLCFRFRNDQPVVRLATEVGAHWFCGRIEFHLATVQIRGVATTNNRETRHGMRENKAFLLSIVEPGGHGIRAIRYMVLHVVPETGRSPRAYPHERIDAMIQGRSRMR